MARVARFSKGALKPVEPFARLRRCCDTSSSTTSGRGKCTRPRRPRATPSRSSTRPRRPVPDRGSGSRERGKSLSRFRGDGEKERGSTRRNTQDHRARLGGHAPLASLALGACSCFFLKLALHVRKVPRQEPRVAETLEGPRFSTFENEKKDTEISSQVGGMRLEFLKAASEISQKHYPDRTRKYIIINAPSWRASASFRLVEDSRGRLDQ